MPHREGSGPRCHRRSQTGEKAIVDRHAAVGTTALPRYSVPGYRFIEKWPDYPTANT
jgi:hypothetical protein